MEHQPPGDTMIQVDAAAASSTNHLAGARDDDDGDRRRAAFSQAYRTEHRKPMEFTRLQVLLLSYQSLGIVYGDLGTSPLYVFSSITLPDPGEDFVGILSIILWTLTLISLLKYSFVVLSADDHGEGGTFALYSLLRQHVNFKGSMSIPVTRLASDINLKFHGKKSNLSSKILEFLEGSTTAQVAITFIVLAGTSMVIGDGALTPAISGSIREVMVFVTVRFLPVRSVLAEERFLVDKLEPAGVYRCIVQYGYMDNHNMEEDEFFASAIASLKEIAEDDDEITLMDSASKNGSTFVLGRIILKMSTGQNCFKRFVINIIYRFLQKNFQSNISSLKIAPGKTLQVGMEYEISETHLTDFAKKEDAAAADGDIWGMQMHGILCLLCSLKN